MDKARCTAWIDAHAFEIAIGTALSLVLPLLGAVGLFDPWETHYAEVSRSMVVRADYLYPFWKDAYFFSKPILLFWLTAPLLAVTGAAVPDTPMSAWTEWAVRLPSALSSLWCTVVLFQTVERIVNRRAALLSSLCLSTMFFWAMVSRQAITDMLYVSTSSMAVLLMAQAWFAPVDSARAPLPRWLVVVVAASILPQAWLWAAQSQTLNDVQWAGSETGPRTLIGLVLTVVVVGYVWWLKTRAVDPLLQQAALCLALSLLAKGPVGAATGGATLVFTGLLLRDGRLLWRKGLWGAAITFLLVAIPWPVTMLLFHGLDEQRKTWFQRFVLYDLLGRVGPGAHGDRGGFEYYLRTFAYGAFPWSGLVPIAFFSTLTREHPRDPRQRLQLLLVVWLVVIATLFAFTTTKFHHYILPACVPAALLVGLWLAELWDSDAGVSPIVAVAAMLMGALVLRDIADAPWTWVDLFTYHYKGYKPEYYFPQNSHMITGVMVTCLVLLLLPTAILALARLAFNWWQPHDNQATQLRAVHIWVVVLVGCAWLSACAGIYGYHHSMSVHWSQRDIIREYHRLKKDGDVLIPFQMDWKGETFYSKNQDIQVKKDNALLRKLVAQPGRAFVIVQTDRLSNLKSALGSGYEDKITTLFNDNVKWILVAVDDDAP